MNLPRRRFLHLAAGVAALPRSASALDYPTRPVRIVVGFPAGGATDIYARLIAQWLAERLGQPFTVENRPGASTNLAAEMVVHSPPDGYTLMAFSITNTVNPALFTQLNFNFVRDMSGVNSKCLSSSKPEISNSGENNRKTGLRRTASSAIDPARLSLVLEARI